MPKPDRLARTIVDASLELYRRRSWQGVDPDGPISIRVPTEDEPLSGLLVGPGEGDFGLFLSQGPDSLGRLLRQEGDDELGGEHFEQCDHLLVLFTRLGEIRDDLRELLTAAGFQTRREKIAPCICAKPAGKQLRKPNKSEQKTIAWCLAAVLGAEDRGALKPVPATPGAELLELEVSGKLTEPEVAVRWVPLELDRLGALAAPLLLPDSLAERPRLDVRWCLAMAPVPGGVEGDDRMFHAVLILDEETEHVLSAELVPGSGASLVVDSLIDAVEERGLPAGIVFNRETLVDALAPALAGLEVKTALERDHPLLLEAAEDIERFLGLEGDDGEEGDELADPPTTLEEWKRADLEFGYCTAEDLEEQDVVTPRALKEYFGSEEQGLLVLDELADLEPLPAFIEWLAADYRPNKRSKPYFDRRLEDPELDDVERALIESRRGALLSFFQVISTEPGASLVVEDIFDRRQYTLYDSSLSGCEVEGYLLPLRLFRLDRWYVPSIAGPPISCADSAEVIDQLRSLGVPPSAKELRADSQLMGRVWVWYLKSCEE